MQEGLHDHSALQQKTTCVVTDHHHQSNFPNSALYPNIKPTPPNTPLVKLLLLQNKNHNMTSKLESLQCPFLVSRHINKVVHNTKALLFHC